jgi:PPP family 3-phenylpropionic acid transporter
MMGLAAGALAAFAFYASAGTFSALCVGAVAVGVFFPPLMPMGENLTLLAAQVRRFDYGRVRLWGSLTFIAGAWGGGAWLAGRPEALIPLLVLAAGVLTVLACAALPDVRIARGPGAARALGRLLATPAFLVFLAAASLIQSSHAAYYGFATLHWRAAGIGEGTIGLLWAEGVVAEIVLFAFAAPVVRRVGIVPLFAIGAAAGVLRWLVTGATTELWALALVQALHAGTFGCTHLAAMHFLQRAIPSAVSASAQALYSSLAMGVVLALAMMAAGALYAGFAGAAFTAMAAMTLAGGAFAVLLARLWDGGELRLGPPS